MRSIEMPPVQATIAIQKKDTRKSKNHVKSSPIRKLALLFAPKLEARKGVRPGSASGTASANAVGSASVGR